MLLRDEGAHLRALRLRVPHDPGGGSGDEAGEEALVNGALDEDALAGEADLALVQEGGVDRRREGALKVAVGEDECRVLAAELERALLQALACGPDDQRESSRWDEKNSGFGSGCV